MTRKELQALFMRGAQAGALTLVGLLEGGSASGAIKPRDLAVVTGILTDKLAKLAPLVAKDDEAASISLEEMEREHEEHGRLLAELRRCEDAERSTAD
jgi:hypothetical protein